MKRVAKRAALATLLVALVVWASAPLLQDLGRAAPPGSKAAGTEAATAAAPKAEAWSMERFEEWIGASDVAMVLLWGLKAALMLLGVGFLVREILREDRRAHGHAPPGPEFRPFAVATAGEALGLLAIFWLGAQVLLVSLFPPGSARPGGELNFAVLTAVASLAPLGLLVVLRRQRIGGTARLPARAALGHGVAFACIATLLVIPVGLAWGVALDLRGVALEVQNVVQKFAQPDDPSQPWVLAVFGVVVAPFTEEAAFRGLLYPSLRARMPGGALGAAVAVSLVFALIHNSLVSFLPLFVLAMVLAWVMERTGSLLACFVVHALHNAAAVVPMLVRHLEGP